jgi:ATP-dependent Zn protease
MPSDQKDLRNAKAGTDPVVDFDYNELLAELEKEIPSEIDLSTEVCTTLLVERGHSLASVKTMLLKKEKSGELISRWATYKGLRVKAYRKSR